MLLWRQKICRSRSKAVPKIIRSLPRVLNGEGREGDMPNLIFMAKEDDLQGAFARSGRLKVGMERAARLRAALSI
jgi:hypothetical protein